LSLIELSSPSSYSVVIYSLPRSWASPTSALLICALSPVPDARHTRYVLLSSTARLARRIAITAVGFLLIVVGGVLLVAPGPGFLVIALGLLVLGVEYDWARRRFEQVRDKAIDLADKAAANKLSATGSLLFGVGMLGFGVALIVAESLPGSGWATGISIIIAGLAIMATIIYSLVTARQRQTIAD